MRSSLVQKRACGLWPWRRALLWTSAWHAGSGWGNRFRKTRREARGVVASADVEPGGAGARAGKEGRYRPDTSGRAITGEATAPRIIAQARAVVGGCLGPALRGHRPASILSRDMSRRGRRFHGCLAGPGWSTGCLAAAIRGGSDAGCDRRPHRGGAPHGNLRRPRTVPWERRPRRDNGGGTREAFSVSACVRRRRPCPGRRGSR